MFDSPVASKAGVPSKQKSKFTFEQQSSDDEEEDFHQLI